MEQPDNDEHQQHVTDPILPASPIDDVISILIGLISLCVTAPFFFGAVVAVYLGERNALLAFMWILGWCLWLLGLPTAIVVWTWHQNAGHGRTKIAYLTRTYWKAQLLTYGLTIPLTLLLFDTCTAMFK